MEVFPEPERSQILLVRRLCNFLTMSFISVLSCLSLLLAVGVAQYPKPCVVPELLSGGLTVMTGDGLISSTGLITYDALGQRMRVKNFGIGDNQDFALDQLMLFREGVYYESNWKTLSCKKMKLDSSFIPMQVPPDAKLMGQVFMGSSSSWGMGVLTNTWYGSLSENGFYSTVFTEIGCIPVSFTSYTPQSGWLTVSTFNWVIGTSNPMDYLPPDFCANSELEETETPHNFFTVMESLAMKSKRIE
ncbi:ependymin [Haplochromis burtoni]|nr:ependymin [Haplochromis burtoni]